MLQTMVHQDAVNPIAGAGPRRHAALAALAILATRLGIDTGVDQLRRRFSVGDEEPDTATLVAMARELGLEAKSLHMTFGELPRLSKTLPAILRSKDGGALLLEDARADPMQGSVAVIRDPQSPNSGLVEIEEIQLTELWEGEVILVKRIVLATGEQKPFGMAWLIYQVIRERKLFRDIGISAVASTVFAIAPPLLFMLVLDKVLVNSSFNYLNVLTAAILIVIASETVLGYFQGILTQVATTRIDGRLDLFVMEKILKLPMDYFESNPTGRTLEKLRNLAQIRTFLTGELFGTSIEAVPLLGIIPAMLIINWQLALIAFALASVMFVIVLGFLTPLKNSHERLIRAEQARSAYLVETFYGIHTIKSLNLEDRRRKEWDKLVAEATAARHSLGVLANYPQTLIAPFQRLIYIGCFAIGAYWIVLTALAALAPAGSAQAAPPPVTTLTSGLLFGFIMLSSRLVAPLVSVASLQQNLAEVRGAIHAVASVVNVPPEATRINGMRLPVKGEISFKDVRFRYAANSPYALDHVSFTVPKGTTLGIMGRSGSGKTTVTRILQRLHSGYEGMIKIDGMDLREIDLMHLRTSIGVVPQENFLFSGTIRDNIAMARPDASFLEVVRAAQLAGAEEFIERLPRTYDTMLEERATNLSGGQRQRLAIARALLIDPPVLILDEATSALDAESEAIVNANLKRISKGRTVISISHRLSMLVEADAILVLERGKVYDLGTHEELLRRCDIYRDMWHQQNRHLDPRAGERQSLIQETV